MSGPKKRHALVAALFNAAVLGLGFLYLGNVRWAFAMLFGWVAILALGAWTRLVFVPVGFYSVTLLVFAAWFASIVIAWRLARRQTPAPLTKWQRWYWYLAFVVIAWAVVDPLLGQRGTFLGYETYRFPSLSMRETLLPGDDFISDAWKYRTREPVRGELVVFSYPRNPSIRYVQRVIGLPGETITVNRGEVLVNGAALEEPYIEPSNNHGLPVGNGEYSVPDNSYFMLGDNRDNSSDSRFMGMVPRSNVNGSVEFIWFSYDANNGVRFERLGHRVN